MGCVAVLLALPGTRGVLLGRVSEMGEAFVGVIVWRDFSNMADGKTNENLTC